MPPKGLKLGSKIWVKDQDTKNPDVFVMAELKGLVGGHISVVTSKGEEFQTDTYFPANPADVDQSDHTALLHLSDATLLHNTRMRYLRDDIYTYVGPILVSVNPFKYIPKLYAPELMGDCKKFPPGHPLRPPHTFSMAEAAYMQMRKRGVHQSLVVSGESGAGKTEVNKQCMNYLVWRASSVEHADLSTRILQSNPILEATGNAKTVRNNNSSRFGKYVAMRFDERCQLEGAEVQTFLLEKSRVVSTTAAGERNYHIFYHVLLGAGLLSDTDPAQQRLLNRSSCTTVPNVDDVDEYRQVVQAMSDIGMSSLENAEVQQGIAAILALGNLDFGDSPDDQAALSDPNLVQFAMDCLGAPELEQALLKATLKVSKTEAYTIELDATKAAAGRDAFVKAIYQRVFDLLVRRVNESLTGGSGSSTTTATSGGKGGKGSLCIGLLDVFGFEIFEINSLEQLCINHTNEKLQNFFLRSVFKAEEIAYKNDGITWEPIPYTDNGHIIEIIEGKTKGVFDTLDSVCKAPKATDEMLAKELHESHAKSKILCRPKAGGKAAPGSRKLTDREAFVMRHFAGEVMYCVDGWLEKNNDKLSDDYEKIFATSSKELVASQLAKREEEPEPEGSRTKQKKGKGTQTVSRGFLTSLRRLMEALETTEAHFIRCIKPNNELKPNLLYGAFVLSQLKCSGTLEAVELMQRGYPSRIPFEDIYSRYAPLMPDFVKELGSILNGSGQELRPSQFVEAIAMAFGLEEADYQLGQYKIFLRSGKAAFLEELKDADINEMIPIIVTKIKEFERKKAAKALVARKMLVYVWRRRIRKLKELKKKAEEQSRREAAMSSKLKKAAGKKEKGKKAAGSQRHMMPHEIASVIGDMVTSPREMTTKPKKGQPVQAAVKLSQQRSSLEKQGGGGGGGMSGSGMAGGMLPAISAMGYGPRVVSKTLPIDPNDTSSFSINIPMGAKAIIKQAVEEYKQTNALGGAELSLLDKLLANLGTAAPPTQPFGGTPSGSTPAGGPPAPTDLTDEVTDGPQLFEYEDIAHSGHLMVKQVDLVPSTKKKKKKKEEEFVEEYFILLNSKHLVHFQPTTGFVDPFKKTISGKAIDLLHSSVKMSDGEADKDLDLNQFEITTGRCLYLLKPKDGESSAAGWVEKITETMLAVAEGDTDHIHNAADRDYGTALQGYTNVKPDDVRT